MMWILALVAIVVAILFVPALRRAVVTGPVFALYKKILPQMSQTEREALEAGTVWWEGELFRGKPTGTKLLAYPQPKLTAEEQSFLDNEVRRSSAAWSTTGRSRTIYQDMSPEAWQYIKDKGFLGMIIPKKYGGLEFSAYAHSQVVQKLSTRCSARGGVGDGAELARARPNCCCTTAPMSRRTITCRASPRALEIPAFALTSPWAGSDAASIPDVGHRLQGAVARPRSARHARHLGQALHHARRRSAPCSAWRSACTIPTACSATTKTSASPARWFRHDHPGVNIGRRHLPLNARLPNGPTAGKDVFMPLDCIIGGPAMAGQRLAHADGMPGGGPFDLAAVVEHRHGQADGARHRRLCARAQPVQDCRSASSRASRKRWRAWAATST